MFIWVIRNYHEQLVYEWRKYDVLLLFIVRSVYMLMVTTSNLQAVYLRVKKGWNGIVYVFVHVKSYGYFTGSLSKAQQNLARKSWWLLCMTNNHCVCLWETCVLPISKDALAQLARFRSKSTRRTPIKAFTTSCDSGFSHVAAFQPILKFYKNWNYEN